MISCLYEHVDKIRVEQLIKHNDVDNDEKTIEELLEKIRPYTSRF